MVTRLCADGVSMAGFAEILAEYDITLTIGSDTGNGYSVTGSIEFPDGATLNNMVIRTGEMFYNQTTVYIDVDSHTVVIGSMGNYIGDAIKESWSACVGAGTGSDSVPTFGLFVTEDMNGDLIELYTNFCDHEVYGYISTQGIFSISGIAVSAIDDLSNTKLPLSYVGVHKRTGSNTWLINYLNMDKWYFCQYRKFTPATMIADSEGNTYIAVMPWLLYKI